LENSSVIEKLRNQTDARDRLESMTTAQLQQFVFDWALWARPNQVRPAGDWSVWMILAGRGFVKTRVGAETVRGWHADGFRHINLIGRNSTEADEVMVDGESGLLACCQPDERPKYFKSKKRIVWPNGAVSRVFSAEEPDALRGPQSDKLWADEVASWRYDEDTWDQAQFGLRLGANPQAVVTTTPRPTKFIRKLLAEKTTLTTRGTTYENRSNLARKFFEKIITKYEGTRLGRQELNAELLDDNPNALFKLSDIEGARVAKLPPLTRIVVAMDPATTSNEESDEWGIIAAGQDGRDPAHFYVIADESAIYTPDEAAKAAVRLYHRLGADRLIGEANNGGDMIEALVRHQDANVAYKKVTASRGKTIRAEPISSLYEQHRAHHHGMFATLEDQMTTWNPKVDDESPDRVDGMVWALTELAGGTDGWAGFVRSEAKDAAAEGRIPSVPTSRTNIEGGNRDICECGSAIWRGEVCFKCGKARPTV